MDEYGESAEHGLPSLSSLRRRVLLYRFAPRSEAADRTISNGQISHGLAPMAFAAIVGCPSDHISDPFERSEVVPPRPPGRPFGGPNEVGSWNVRIVAAACRRELACVIQVRLDEDVACVKQVS
jgi:hypothetical protein